MRPPRKSYISRKPLSVVQVTMEASAHPPAMLQCQCAPHEREGTDLLAASGGCPRRPLHTRSRAPQSHCRSPPARRSTPARHNLCRNPHTYMRMEGISTTRHSARASPPDATNMGLSELTVTSRMSSVWAGNMGRSARPHRAYAREAQEGESDHTAGSHQRNAARASRG